jgi:diguanylate cyclase (GGDEF)-like protein
MTVYSESRAEVQASGRRRRLDRTVAWTCATFGFASTIGRGRWLRWDARSFWNPEDSMRQIPLLGWLYFGAVYLMGAEAALWLIVSPRGPLNLSLAGLAIGLAAMGAVAQMFPVQRAGTSYSDHLTPAPLFAAFLLLPPPLVVAVVAITFLPEWLYFRRRWFTQSFNVASWLIALAMAERIVSLLVAAPGPGPAPAIAAPTVIVTLAVMMCSQTLLIAWGLRFVEGQMPTEVGLFSPANLLSEATLFCAGWALATTWRVDPLDSLGAALPLVLLFRALHFPNLREEATTDAKTGLANVRHFNAVVDRELARAHQSAGRISVLMCDLDYLRNINNVYGHRAGDIVLNGIARIIQGNTRSGDLAARFGGEEFCVLLVGADSASATIVAERIRRAIEHSRFVVGREDQLVVATISTGVASYPGDGDTREVLMHEADLALYQAKREGRNRVVVSGHTSRALAAEWAEANPEASPARGRGPSALLRLVRDPGRSAAETRQSPAPLGTLTSSPESTSPNPRSRS